MLDFTVIGQGASQARLLQLQDPTVAPADVQAAKTTSSTQTSVNILADPGWNGTDLLDETYTDDFVASLDMILLSQSTAPYIGAYVYLMHTYPQLRQIPTYSTLPVSKMGQVMTCELYRTIGLLGPVRGNLIEYSEVIKIFNNVKHLNYSQTIGMSHVNNKLINLSLTAYNSGYSIGGSIWLIENNINERIVYAPVWNHAKDEFLNNCKIFNNPDLIRPTTFITNCEYTSTKLTHQNRIDQFIDIVQKNLETGTSVLLPTSLTGRFFELIIPLLTNIQRGATIYMVNFTGLENLKFLSNFLEWMNANITKLWESEDQSRTILENNRIQVIKYDELESLLSSADSRYSNRPNIFLVDDMGLNEQSMFAQFLIDLSAKLSFTMILTEPPNNSSKLSELYKIWQQHVGATETDSKEGSLIVLEKPDFELQSVKETLIRGKDLAAYEKEIKDRREMRAKMEKEELERRRREEMLVADVKESDDEDDEDEIETANANAENIMSAEQMEKEGSSGSIAGAKDNHQVLEITANIIKEAEAKYQFDESKFLKMDEILTLPRDFDVSKMKHKHRMFPMVTHKFNVDDYGVVIKHDDFQIFDDDRFPILNAEGMLSDIEGEEDLESESDVEIENTRKRGRGGRGRRGGKRRKGSGKSDDVDSAIPKKKITVYSLDSLVDPVSRTITKVKVNIRCGFTFFDLSGNHDLRSLKFTTKQIKPRKVIILPELQSGNSESLMAELSRDTKRDILSGTINVEVEYIRSKLNEKICLGNVITSYEISLDSKLIAKLQWQTLNDEYNVATVSGTVEKIKEWEYRLKEGDNSTVTLTTSVKIGDIKLNQLRTTLRASRHHVEFMGDGKLVVDERLIVTKGNEGQLSIESGLGPLFYEVKNVIEGMLATI